MKQLLSFAIAAALFISASAQTENARTSDKKDTVASGRLTVSGYVDIYYGYDFSEPAGGIRPYAISSSRHGEFNINLAYIDIRYRNDRIRARLIPGVGTYMNTNYATETETLKNIVEANAGIKLFKEKEIWVDAGVLPAPYTNESAISKDHLMYTRSFAPEASPYYISGVRLSTPLGNKLTVYVYAINGWQQISDVNRPLAMTSQVEYKPAEKFLVNLTTYTGSEESSLNPTFRSRSLLDIYMIYNPKGRFSFIAGAYSGIQYYKDTLQNRTAHARWWQANSTARYRFNPALSLAGRLEYFEDPEGIVIKPVTGITGFSSWSTGLCFDVKVTGNALFRIEGRHFFSDREVFFDTNGMATSRNSLLITSLAAWF